MAQPTLLGKEETDETEEEKKGKREKQKNVKKEDNKDKMFGRVKDRLSLRKGKKDKKVKITNEEENTKNNSESNQTKTKDAEVKTADNGKVVDEAKKEDKGDSKETNFIQRIINFFSSKNKRKGSDTEKEEEKEIEKESVTEENKEPVSVEVEEPPTPPSPRPRPVTPASKPPPAPRSAFLSAPPRPPSSATATQSRPLSQLDTALRQFKETTAASRENLRSSHQDLSQVEEQVRTMTASLSRNNSLRRTTSPSTTIPITLSASLTDLRQKKAGQKEAAMERASVCVN